MAADHYEDPLLAGVVMARFVDQIQFAAVHLFGEVLVFQNVGGLAVQAFRVPVDYAGIVVVATVFGRSIQIRSRRLFQKAASTGFTRSISARSSHGSETAVMTFVPVIYHRLLRRSRGFHDGNLAPGRKMARRSRSIDSRDAAGARTVGRLQIRGYSSPLLIPNFVL